MSIDIDKLIKEIMNGKYSRQKLEILRNNGISKDIHEVISACNEMLIQLPKSGTGSRKNTQGEVIESRSGFVIMQSAYGSDQKLLRPEYIKVAEELALNPHVEDISILKTQIKLYYKGRHFTSGQSPKKEIFWLSCLDETKITDSTVESWKNIGNVYRAKYFSTYYVGVNVKDLADLHTALNSVIFT